MVRAEASKLFPAKPNTRLELHLESSINSIALEAALGNSNPWSTYDGPPVGHHIQGNGKGQGKLKTVHVLYIRAAHFPIPFIYFPTTF